MIDRFYLHHRRIVLRDQKRRRIPNRAFERASQALKLDIDLPDRSLVYAGSVGDNVALYGLWLRQMIKRLGQGELLEEELLQIVLLHRLLQLIPTDTQDVEQRTTRAAIGAMIQKNLALLLCEVELGQWERIYNIRRLPNVNRDEWECHIAGASAVTYVMLTLASRETALLFLPAAHEDVFSSIDLLWIEDGLCHAISVKSVTGQDTPVRTWYVHESPTHAPTDQLCIHMRRIFSGANTLSRQDGRPCAPVLVYVCKPNGSPIRLDQDWKRLTWPDQILTLIRDERA